MIPSKYVPRDERPTSNAQDWFESAKRLIVAGNHASAVYELKTAANQFEQQRDLHGANKARAMLKEVRTALREKRRAS